MNENGSRNRAQPRAVGLLATTTVLALAACTQGGAGNGQDSGTITYSGYGGSYEESIREALFEPFSESSGTEVLYDASGSSIAKLIEMEEAGNMAFDLLDAEDSALAQYMAEDILEEIDHDQIDETIFANPDAVTPYSVPIYQFSRNIFWNTDQISGELESWQDLFNLEEFPGKRGFLDLPWGLLEGALLADGVEVEDLYPLDVDRALAKLESLEGDVVYFSSNGDLQNAIAQGEVVAGYGNLARVKSVAESGNVPISYTWEGAHVSTQQHVIPKGASNPEGAFEAIQYGLNPEVQTEILHLLGYAPSVKSALDELDAETRADLPGTEETMSDQTYSIDTEWWSENGANVLQQWQNWLNS